VKRIEQRLSPPAEETELGPFAEREALLRKAHDAGLTPREHELFKFLIENPAAKNADAARALGVATGTVKSLKARIKKRIHAA
jgi:DNA-binding CsgD family transcriptional regulator